MRFFDTGDIQRARDIIRRVLAFSDAEVEALLLGLERDFQPKHRHLLDIFAEHYDRVRGMVPGDAGIGESRRLLIGACFSMEYALESVALFNPSMVPALRQEGLPTGSVRFLMSLRATGEGHISSIVFRTGVVDARGDLQLDPIQASSRPLKATVPEEFSKAEFRRDLATLGVPLEPARRILDRLPDRFSRRQLSQAIESARGDEQASGFLEEAADSLIAATRVNYQLQLPNPPLTSEAEIVVFPFSDIERHGIEDLRMVRFTDEDGSTAYLGTFTAYNGTRVFPQLLEYRGGRTIDVRLITGRCAQNKGMALFPRRFRGRYAMISRIDNENLYYMESDDVGAWEEARLLQAPKYPWQVVQIGNCGSPLETEAGWLLMTHGVGPMRQYCIGATLLDRDDPGRVIGQTRDPLLMPTEEGRSSGYVPNVVYSCGAMIHERNLIIPYAISDLTTSAARIDLDALLASMERV
jgi:predicted GH43/DUF377 family glycosyl hydrolase